MVPKKLANSSFDHLNFYSSFSAGRSVQLSKMLVYTYVNLSTYVYIASVRVILRCIYFDEVKCPVYLRNKKEGRLVHMYVVVHMVAVT